MPDYPRRLFRLSLVIALLGGLMLPGPLLSAQAAPSARPPSDTPVNADITSNTTWTTGGSPYVVQNAIQVMAGVTLTVQPGVVVKFNAGNNYLQVDNSAALIAEGTTTQPITFTSALTTPAPGNWGSLLVYAGARARLGYCDLAYAGQSVNYGGLYVANDGAVDVRVHNCRIHDNAQDGVYLYYKNTGVVISDTLVANNGGRAFYQGSIEASPQLANLTFSANATNALFINDGNLSHDVILDGSPAALNGSPIVLPGVTFQVTGKTLTIRPGSTIRVGLNGGIYAPSAGITFTLNAIGTSLQPITFTSALANPQPGDWAGFTVPLSSRLHLAYCDLSDAGSSNPSAAIAIYAVGLPTDVTVQRCRIHDNLGAGLYTHATGPVGSVADTRFDHNSVAPIRVDNADGAPAYHNLTFDHNGLNGWFYDFPGGGSSAVRDVILDGSPTGLNGSPFYIMNGALGIGNGVTLTVKPGTEVRLNAGGASLAIGMGGNFEAIGTAAEPITFTSAMIVPHAGDWGTIDLETGYLGDARARLAYCDIGYAGSQSFFGALNVAVNDAQISHCRIHDSKTAAIAVSNAQPQLLLNQFDRDGFGIQTNTPAKVIDARGHWWGAASGPYHPSLNPGGQGLTVTDGVLFDPWLDSPAAASLIVYPNHGGNIGPVSVNVAGGQGLTTTSSIRLTRSGQLPVTGTVQAGQAGAPLQVTFSLSGVVTGTWNLVAVSGGITATLPNGFTVEPGQPPQVWGNIVATAFTLLNHNTSFVFQYGNTGNVDAAPTHFRITLPYSATLVNPPPLPYVLENYGGTDLQTFDLAVPPVPALSTNAVPIRVKAAHLGAYQLDFWGQPMPNLYGDIGTPADPNMVPSVLSPVTTTTSLNAVLRLTEGASTYDMAYSFSVLGPGGSPTPAVDRTTVGGSDYLTVTAGVTPSTSELQAPAEAASLHSVYETAHFGHGVYEAIEAYHESHAAGEKALMQAALIDCLVTNGWLDANDLETLTNLNEAALVTKFASTAGKAINPEIGGYLKALDGVTSEAVNNYLSAAAYAGRFKDLGIINKGSEAIDALYTACGLDFDLKPKPQATFGQFLVYAYHDITSQLYWAIVASFDPNEMVGPQGVGAPRYVAADRTFMYAVTFANTVTATAPAQTVVITDTLDPNVLDLSTLQLGQMTFGDHALDAPLGQTSFTRDVDLRPGKNLIVRVSASFDPGTHVITWQYSSLDPATMALTENALGGFLPADTDGSGEGTVYYSVKPKAGLANGTQIRNNASIVFDLNAPIGTNEWLNTLDTVKPHSSVNALPAIESSSTFTVTWSGSDAASGILDYTVWVSTDGGPYVPWRVDTTLTAAAFHGASGASYRFYSVARDAAGNIEDVPSGPDAMTRGPFVLYLPNIDR